MGLLKAGVGALGGVLADQWREYIYCDSLSSDVLAIKGKKRTSSRSSNTKGEDNVISNGSIIAVSDGQCMLITDQGKIVEVCAEPGEFVYDNSSEPSIFYGPLGENIMNSFRSIGRRFGFGGDAGKDQRVYYFNTKEILGNKYGTPNPVPFRVVDNNIGLDIDITIRCHGEYSYLLTDPLMFYTNVCGNISNAYTREMIDSQLKTELMTALQPAFARISAMGIRYSALPGHTMEISDALNEILSNKWRETRGISIASFGVSSVNASEEDENMIKELQRNATLRNPNMAAAHLVGAQAEAMQQAASNPTAGPFMAFAGMNAARAAGGANAQNLFAMGANQTQGAPAQNTAPPPVQNGWKCACGKDGNQGNFCSECGTARPAGAPLYRCDKCGWTPEDPANPPKFCPECGDRFDENDKG